MTENGSAIWYVRLLATPSAVAGHVGLYAVVVATEFVIGLTAN